MNNIRIWVGGVIAVTLVVVIAGWTLGISPILTQISAANAQAATIQASNAQNQAQLTTLRTQFNSIDTLKSNLNKLRESIPEVAGASTFFNELTTLSATYGVTITSVTLADASVYTDPGAAAATAPADDSATTATTATTPATSVAPTAPPAGSGLLLVPVSISVTGAFSNVRDFTGAVQTGPRLIFMASLGLSTSADGLTATATISGDIFTLQGTSDVVTKQKLIPTPTATATPTATPTPTPTATATTSSTKMGSNAPPAVVPTTPATTAPTVDPNADPTTP